jgi:hypothetical protein
MSAQDEVEKVLRSLHVMLSKSEPVKGEPGKVAVDKQQMIDLLTGLNKGIYAIMDEYELTTQSRDRAEREFQKQGEDIVRDANRKAEDIYAASVMYTDEALNHVQEIMRDSTEAVQRIYEEMNRRLRDEEHTVKENQLELKSQLQDLVDTDKYLKLIEDRNREIEREKARKEGKDTSSERVSIYANRQTEVRVNKEYLRKLGLADETDESDESDETDKAPEESGDTAADTDRRKKLIPAIHYI